MNELDLELAACRSERCDLLHFNPNAELPYGCRIEHGERAMNDCIDFLTFLNEQLQSRGIARLETFIMPANFSSIVGEFISLGGRLVVFGAFRNKPSHDHRKRHKVRL